MKNHKQLLMDFYLELLKMPSPDKFGILRREVLLQLSSELGEAPAIVKRIFERMAAEDER